MAPAPPAAALASASAPAEAAAAPAGEGAGGDGEDDTPPPKSRRGRRETYWRFVADDEEAAKMGVSLSPGYVMCRLGCLSKDGSTPYSFSAPSTGAVTRHLRTKHPDMDRRFSDCKESRDSWNRLDDAVNGLEHQTMERLKKSRRNSEKFFTKLTDGLEREARSQLLLLLWSVVNGVPRQVLNCPILDAYHQAIGAQPPANRHTLQDSYLPVLDSLVVNDLTSRLKNVVSASLSADGWRDRVKRDWISVGMYWIEGNDSWRISVAHPDLIFLASDATSESIHLHIAEIVDSFVRFPFSLRSWLYPLPLSRWLKCSISFL